MTCFLNYCKMLASEKTFYLVAAGGSQTKSFISKKCSKLGKTATLSRGMLQ